MAPSRKKGGGKAAAAASARRQWKVGDLVLAKLKGFPAWPAAVSEPEKWGYSTDKKKVLVHFFGTQQIAFCNPADVESFTEEKKQSLLTKRHAKGSDFVRAVKEITESYEKLKQLDESNGPKSAEETTVGSSGNTIELPQASENLAGTRLDTQIESSSNGRDETTLLSEDASAAEQMLALRHNSLARNGACDNAAAKDLCEIATHSSKRRNERARSQKCAPQKIVLSVQHSKITSRLEFDRLQRSMRQCSDGGQSVDDIDDGTIGRRKRIRRSGHSESDDMVSSAQKLHGSDEENASEIATGESDNNSRNKGNGVDSGSKVEHSDAVGEGCDGDHELSKGLDFQITTMVKRRKRKPTRKRESSELVDAPTKVEAEEGFGTKACDSCQGSQNSHETLNERPCAENGDEHLPLVKRARVRMSRAFYADEKANASSQFEDRSSKDTPTSAAMQTSPSVNHDNDIVPVHDTSTAKEYNNFELSGKLPGDMVDEVPSHMGKPSGRMSPSMSCVRTEGDKQTAMELHENLFSMTPDDEVTRALANKLGSSLEGNTRVSEGFQGCSEESQTINCSNVESDPIDMQCTRQSENNGTPLNPDTVDSSVNNPPSLCSGLDMTASWVPAQSPHQHQSQDHDSCDHTLVAVEDSSLKEKCENIDNVTQGVQSQVVEHSPPFCSVVNNQAAENTLLETKQGSVGKELDSGKQAQIMQNPAPSVTGSYMMEKEGKPQYGTVHSHCEDAVENKELEKSCEGDEQIQATNSVSVSENLSREKMSLSPDSPARGTPHGNSVCPMSTVESANCMQNNSNCSTSGEKKTISMSVCIGSCEAYEQIQATNSVSVSENLSREKMSLSPDSPARGTPHGNSVCPMSTVESANGMQNNSNCSTNGEKKTISDDTVKEERRVEISVTQVKKNVSSDVQFTIESFETALASLVRTKETIGRATRLAMDLVKFGMSAKAMEILAHTLESESNLQRRVDLFFLVDSIAQCSKGLSGDAGGVYLSSIQVMLPRLLAAAVPAGATTQENRRQCLKVLRLWLERRILPESIVRHHIRELDSHSNVPACLYSRRSARTERALDDPVRDMEGMLVDEYGSNSTLQLHGLCMPAMLKVEDEGSDSDGGEFEPVTPEHESRILEEHVTPSVTERHTRILEDVDGELEMEDVAPPWEVGSRANPTDQADNTKSAYCQPVSGSSYQNVTSLSPLAPPSQNGFDCSGYPSMPGDHQARMNPSTHCRSPESSYSTRASLSKSMPRGEGSDFQHRPYPSPNPPPPPSHHYYSYMEPDNHMTEGGPSYPHGSHYTGDFGERNYHDSHESMRHAPYESRDNWRYHPPPSHGPRYQDRHKGHYQSSGHHRDSGRFQNHRWSHHSPRAYNNNRHSFQHKPHSEGPVPVPMRDPQGTWHQR
ncbi:protein HUA2-LIKE 3 isoform X1 [Raphanus sativus]|uniref:Protein HUA2-LIKE 3 isoform X1 n=1 Tax=Raphanus sativus TaxID=3726 RepID=A0A6J0NF20_RAPSA|nr:protein HUA2-LIKE 3 isoform X1 [Raphanus sativus]